MIHSTARRLDEPPLVMGLTIPQWAAFIIGGTAVGVLLHALGLPTKPAATIWAFVVPLPVALVRVAEPGRVRPGRALLDCLSHHRSTRRFAAGPGSRRVGLLVHVAAGTSAARVTPERGGVEIPWD